MVRFTHSGKTAFAGAIGTTIEWYDFFIYGTAAGLIFNKIFFPSLAPAVGTLIAFASFSSAFFARPIGGVIFGHFGDRIGRKSMLVLTLTIMGITTFSVGLLPSYESIGVAAPIILVTLRFVQGLALGGEYGGAVLMAVEHAPKGRRGLFGSWVQMGVPTGLILGNVVFLLLGGISSESFAAWGWRIPFLIGGVFVFVGVIVRLRTTESPGFADVKEADHVVKVPITVVVRHYPKQVLLTAGAYLACGATFYVSTVFGLSYGAQQLELSRNVVLSLVLLAMLFTFGALPLFGWLSDKVGRKPVFLCGVISMALGVFPWFWLFNSGSYVLALAGYVFICAGFSASYGPLAAFFAEAYETRIRYSGISFGYTLGTLVGSALAPVIAAALLQSSGGYSSIAWYIIGISAVSFFCVWFMPETYKSDLGEVGVRRPTKSRLAEASRTESPVT